jgi:BED zinc finger
MSDTEEIGSGPGSGAEDVQDVQDDPIQVQQPDDDAIEVVQDLAKGKGKGNGKGASKRKQPDDEAGVEAEGASKSKRKRIHKRNVLLWEKFSETSDKFVVICNINPMCKAKIRRPDGSTSGMISHFQTKHPMQYAEYLAQAKEALKEKVLFK